MAGQAKRHGGIHNSYLEESSKNWRFYSEYPGGILVDQGAHVFDGIHLLMSTG